MRKLFLLVVLGFFAGSIYAQDETAGKVKNEGNNFLRAKNYKDAFAKYEEYLKLIDFKGDDATIFNTAVCADKIKNYVAAEKYFDMSIKNNYKPVASYQGKAKVFQQQKKIPEMIKVLEDGMKANPGNGDLEKMYTSHFLREGQTFQKANNVAKAAENYKMITKLSNKSLKAKGFLSLGTLYFNNGAVMLQKATPLATSDKETYEAEKKKALAEFAKARENLVQASSLAPADAEVKEALADLTKAEAEFKK